MKRKQPTNRKTAKETAEALAPEKLIASLLTKLRASEAPSAFLLETCRGAIADLRADRPEGWQDLHALTGERLAAAMERADPNPSMYATWRKWVNQERDYAPEAGPEEMQRAITRSLELGLTRRGVNAESLPFTAEGKCAPWYRKRLELAGDAATANAIDRDAEERIRARQSAAGE